MEEPDTPPGSDTGTGLRRTLSLPMVTYFGIGNILGAGIYVLIGKVAGHAGAQAPLSFLLAAVLAGFTAFSYAELAARYPLSAGEVAYVEHGLGIRRLSILVGVLIILSGIVSSATIIHGFVDYLQVFLSVPDTASIILVALALGALCAWGISQSVFIAAVMTVIEIAGLLLIVGVATPDPAALLTTLDQVAQWPDAMAAQGIVLGAFLAFYAFIGFEDMVNVAEEVRNPGRNLPLAILIALATCTLLYVVVAVVALSAARPEQLAAADAPLAFLYRQATGAEPVLITLVSLVAVINGALIQIIMASRVCYGMARGGSAPAWLGSVNPATRTPLAATLLITLMVILMALWLPIEDLARATSFFILLVFTLVNLALWRIKQRPAGDYAGFRVYRWVPLAGGGGALLFILLQFAASLPALLSGA